MSALATWMVDTFVYTSALIALVLLVRNSVARHFGPQIAYALWALPLLRLLLPPIVLPASMAPVEATGAASGPLTIIVSDPAMNGEAGAAAMAAASAAPPVGIAVTDLLLPLWLAGAALFLMWRAREYGQMRREMLADARSVGEAGKVRLVETPAVSAPIAFGVLDKVVALPPAFMALHDMKARDLAIAHELAHHRGLDLLANIAAQPLLALHWFNPLAWWGWRAMRRDQEAACDARVVAGAARSDRAAYAQVIAGFAAGEHLALAAPMACPMLGEKSIIHRLRSLTMSEVSSRRHKFGILAITTTALALPLTASISYAQAEREDAAIGAVDPDEQIELVILHESDEGAGPGAGHGRRVIRIERDEDTGTGENRVVRRVIRTGEGEELTEAEFEAMMAEIEAEMAEVEGTRGQVEHAMHLAEIEMERAEGERRMVIRRRPAAGLADDACAQDEGVTSRQLDDGRHAITICQHAMSDHAAAGLREALSEIRNDLDIPAGVREQIIRGLEAALADMEATAQLDRSGHVMGEAQYMQAKLDERAAQVDSVASVNLRWQGQLVLPVRFFITPTVTVTPVAPRAPRAPRAPSA